MSVWQKAYETYENHAHLAGVVRIEDRQPLAPVGHMIAKAHIEIAIDVHGNLQSAGSVAQENCKTAIPVTEDSASRSGKTIAPHPLSEQLIYLSGVDAVKHTAYLQQLQKWADSEFSTKKVRAILRYIQNGTIIDDLARWNVLSSKKSDVSPRELLKGQEKALVRWVVYGDDQGDSDCCWKDQTLIRAFQRYRAQEQANAEKVFCMISGKQEPLCSKHPKGIVASPNGAKLISSNDSGGFTYRGRFTDEKQAATIGYDASQKAHNALQWVIANQGKIQGGRSFVCWNPKGKPVYQVCNMLLDEDTAPTEPSDYLEALERTLAGYRNELPNEEDVVIAAFDAATTGRLAVAYYNELRSSDYYDRVAAWYQTCCFPLRAYHGQAPAIWSPLLYRIICSAYGTERGKQMELDDRILREQMQLLLNCMIEKTPVPYNLVQALRNRASQPLAYTQSNRDQVLFSACSIIRKYYNDCEGREVWTMTLDTKNTDRSYLFGRLLAIMEAAERSTYDRDEQREPNAIRMQTVYCERPLNTANIIHNSLSPYFQRMKPGVRKYYRDLVGEVFAMLSESDTENLDRRLEDTYLLGYYLQRNAIYTKKTSEEEK